MRHGQSLANVAGLVVSRLENGVTGYGLSELGRQQVFDSVTELGLVSDIRVISSDFKRAAESAEIAHQVLHSKFDLVLDIRLRERGFGDFELLSDENYQIPWGYDADDSTHTLIMLRVLIQ